MKLASSSLRLHAAAALLLAVLSLDGASGARAQTASLPPIPPGQARFWLYRVFFAGDTLSMPAVAIDNAPAGYALAGTSFYRDVPAGTHVVSVESRGTGLDQAQQVAVGPGQELYVQIASMPNWEEDARGRAREPSFAVMVMSPRMAWLQMPLTAFQGGS